jgi:hypothetical protein
MRPELFARADALGSIEPLQRGGRPCLRSCPQQAKYQTGRSNSTSKMKVRAPTDKPQSSGAEGTAPNLQL